ARGPVPGVAHGSGRGPRRRARRRRRARAGRSGPRRPRQARGGRGGQRDEPASSDGDNRSAAVEVIGKTGDPKWLAFLGALRDGGVYARKKADQLELVVGGAQTNHGDKDLIEIKNG